MKKLVLLALAAASVAMFALPAVASAGEWVLDPAGAAFTASSNGPTTLTTNNNETVNCTGSTGSGKYNAGSGTTGTVELTFTGCTESIFGTSCSNTATAGTITTTSNLAFTNVYLSDNKETPGTTIAGVGAEKHFATFTCAGGSVKIVVTGSLLGHSEAPCKTVSKELKNTFESTAHGVQKYMKVTGTEAAEDLTAKVTIFGATNTRTASQDGTGILKFNEAATITCV